MLSRARLLPTTAAGIACMRRRAAAGWRGGPVAPLPQIAGVRCLILPRCGFGSAAPPPAPPPARGAGKLRPPLTEEACPHCGASFHNQEDTFAAKDRYRCRSCRAIKPSEPLDFDDAEEIFGLFELPVEFDITEHSLRELYVFRMAALHPDRHAQGSARDQQLAEAHSQAVTLAFRLLTDPVQRGQLVLRWRERQAREDAGEAQKGEDGRGKLIENERKRLENEGKTLESERRLGEGGKASSSSLDTVNDPQLLSSIFDWEDRADGGDASVFAEVRDRLAAARAAFRRSLLASNLTAAKKALQEWRMYLSFLKRRDKDEVE